jgi:outer membrane protein OmpA-like peptidoglycan-associated protein
MSRRTNRQLAVGLVLTGLVWTATACGPGAKGESLLELEALRSANYTRTIRTDPVEVENVRVQEIRQSAASAINQSDRWYNGSIDAWESIEEDKSEEMARQGILLYQAAAAYSRAADARDRIEMANADYQRQLERRNQYNDMVATNEEFIELLTALQQLFEQTADCRAELAGFSAERQAEVRAEQALQQARFQQREAENRHVNEFAPTLFDEGVRLVANSAEYVDAQLLDLATDAANLAVSRFREAMVQSESQFQALQSSLLRRSAHEQLFQTAVQHFGDDASIDGRGLVIVIPDLFAERRSDVAADKTYLLDQLSEMAHDNRRMAVTIEGHTSDRGSREANLTLSRARAEAVRDYMTDHNVRSSQLSLVGLGEDYPRFENATADGRSSNNRIEIIFSFE